MKCCDMNAGMLRTPVTFYSKALTTDGAGGYTSADSAISGAPTFCHFKSLSGYERMMAARLDAQTKARIVVRYHAGINENDTAEIGGEKYQIRYINNLEMRNMWLEIDLEGGVAL